MILVAKETAFSNLFWSSIELTWSPHQLYGTPELLYQICMLGIRHLNDHLEFYVESISNISWELIMFVKVLELL